MGSILAHVNRVVRANLSWLLAKAAGPVAECEQKISEIQDAIEKGRTAAASYGATYHRMVRQRDQLRDQQNEWQSQAGAALEAGNESHARKLLGKKVVLEERIASLSPGIERGKDAYDQLCESINDLRDQLSQTRARLAELKARQSAAEAHIEFDDKLGPDSAHSEQGLDAVEDKVFDLESEVEVRQELRQGAALDRKLRRQSRDMQVDAELETLRQQLETPAGNEETEL